MVASAVSLYAGAAIAVGLFAAFPAVVVAWFRIAGAAVLLVALRRPALRAFWGRSGYQAAAFGVVTMAMNMTFYQAISHIPLGTAVAIEFIGPVLVAAWGSRRRRDWLALALAVVGVVVISGAVWSTNAVGILWALTAGMMWAAYIVLGSRIAGDAARSRTSVAVGFTWAAVLAMPMVWLLWPDASGVGNVKLAVLILGLGLLSAALPYSLDQVVLRMAGAGYFALLQAILPMVATIIGALFLAQWLSAAEVIGVVLVIAAVALRKP